MKRLKIEIPSGANEIIHTLQNNGYEAFLVGGCVRDSILGRPIHDYDITTSATPDESLVTIEVRDNRIVQARRKFNDPVTAEEQEIIDKFNNKFSKRKEDVA